MLHGKINTGKRLAALALCGLFALQAGSTGYGSRNTDGTGPGILPH
ncbi:MAG: hypothetical protein V8S58_15460 [Lachnospiraceae bacterium]